MTNQKQQREWFRLAFAGMAFALLVMLVPQQGAGSARTSAYISLSPASVSPSFSARWTSREWPALAHATSADHGAWMSVLPVLFIGLLAPLELSKIRLIPALSRTPNTPALPSAFQRPPPHLA